MGSVMKSRVRTRNTTHLVSKGLDDTSRRQLPPAHSCWAVFGAPIRRRPAYFFRSDRFLGRSTSFEPPTLETATSEPPRLVVIEFPSSGASAAASGASAVVSGLSAVAPEASVAVDSSAVASEAVAVVVMTWL